MLKYLDDANKFYLYIKDHNFIPIEIYMELILL